MASSPSVSAAARSHMLAALLFFSAMTFVIGTLALLTRSGSLAGWIDRKNEESCRETRRLLLHRGWFQQPDELWIYDRAPKADYSKGGVYLLGASHVEYSTKLWELPPGIQTVVHNYGLPAANHRSESVLLRYLIEQRGLLKAGGEKSLVLFGIDYETAVYPCRSLPDKWTDVWVRHGCFTCDPQQGIREAPVNAISKSIEFEETFQAECIIQLLKISRQQLSRWLHHGAEPPRTLDPAQYVAQRRTDMGPDWKRKFAEDVQVLGETIDYLREQHVPIGVLRMPEGRWEQELPFGSEYWRQVAALCAEKHIPTYDWSGMLTDDEFADSGHPNIFGMEKIQSAFLEIARPFLSSNGILNDTDCPMVNSQSIAADGKP